MKDVYIPAVYPPSMLRVSDGVFVSGMGEIVLSDVQCTGNELNISSCPQIQNLQQCSHQQDAGVRCDGPPEFRGTHFFLCWTPFTTCTTFSI